jgi:hypothetical protein
MWIDNAAFAGLAARTRGHTSVLELGSRPVGSALYLADVVLLRFPSCRR